MTFRDGEQLDADSIAGSGIASLSDTTSTALWYNLTHWQIAETRPRSFPAILPPSRDAAETTYAENHTQLGVKVNFDGEEYVIAIDRSNAPFKPTISNIKLEMQYEVCGFKMEMEYQVKEFKFEMPVRLYDLRSEMNFNIKNFKIETLAE